MTLNIIHLAHRKDRWDLLQETLSAQKIDDWRIWPGEVDHESARRGICRSHKQIISFAKEQHQAHVLVAEDDVYFTAPGAFTYFMDHMPDDFDMYLGGITWGKLMDDQTVQDFAGITLYVMHEQFYDKFLALDEEKDADRALAGLGRFVVCEPMVACQQSGYSDNQKKYLDFGPLLRAKKWFTG